MADFSLTRTNRLGRLKISGSPRCDNLALFFGWPGNRSRWPRPGPHLLYRLDQIKIASTLNRFCPFNCGMADVQFAGGFLD